MGSQCRLWVGFVASLLCSGGRRNDERIGSAGIEAYSRRKDRKRLVLYAPLGVMQDWNPDIKS